MAAMRWAPLTGGFQGLRLAARRLATSPGFVALSVLSLAIGIASASFFFSFLNYFLGRTAPHVSAPERLVAIYRAETSGSYGPLSYPEMLDIRDGIECLEGAAAVHVAEHAVGTMPGNERNLQVEKVSENYFDLLGIPIALGRGFSTDDSRSNWEVAVVGYRLWQRELGGDPSAVGRTLRVDGRSFTVVGIAPEGLQAWREPVLPDLWVPFGTAWRDSRGWQGLTVVGRMRPGVGIGQARTELAALGSSLAETYPRQWLDYTGRPASIGALSYRLRGLRPQYRAQLAVVSVGISVAVGLLLLVACSNVANIQLARAFRRRREIAVRLALGAGRGRLVAELLLESFLIASLASAIGLLATNWLTAMLRKGTGPIAVPVALDVTVDLHVVVFTVVVAFLVALASGLAPALQASRGDVVSALKGQEIGGRTGKFGLRRTMVVAQVAGSLVLVVAAGLLLRSLDAVRQAEFGFDPVNVALLSFDLSHRQYDRETGRRFVSDLSQRLSSTPGVTGVAAARTVMLGNVAMNTIIDKADGLPDESPPIRARFNVVTGDYFRVVGTPVVRGREFRESDDEGGIPVAIVNQSLADRLWPGEDPIGKHLSEEGKQVEVVGVVRDATVFMLGEDHELHLWVPLGQRYLSALTVHVRTSTDPRPLLPTLRAQLLALDGELPVLGLDLMEDVVARKSEPQRVTSALLAAAGAVTFGLAIMGVYGVMAFVVSSRTREMGVRVALGARPELLLRLVVVEGLKLSGIGVAIGLALMAALGPLLSVVLYRVSPVDPLASLGGAALLLVAAMAACLIPALRAARVNPAISLRAE